MIDADFLGAGGLALVLVGAVPEAFPVHLADHCEGAFLALRLALRKVAKVGNLGSGEKHGGGVFAGCHAGTATDAGGGIKGVVGIAFGNGEGIRIHGGAGADIDVAAGGDDAVEGGPVGNEVPDDREWLGAEGLDPDGVALGVFPHVDLAGGDATLLAVRDAVDGEGAGAADAFAAIVVEVDWLLALFDQTLVDDVEHFEKGGFRRNVGGRVGMDAAFGKGTGLTPDFEGEVHLRMMGV